MVDQAAPAMAKPFDTKALLKRLQDRGLDVVEDGAKIAVEEVLAWVQDSVVLSENKFDDFTLAVIPVLKDMIMKEVDKIDKKQG